MESLLLQEVQVKEETIEVAKVVGKDSYKITILQQTLQGTKQQVLSALAAITESINQTEKEDMFNQALLASKRGKGRG